MSDGFAYVRRCKDCGGIDAACVDEPSMAREIGKIAASAARLGMVAERVPSTDVRAGQWCTCGREDPDLFAPTTQPGGAA